jgi:hypothetical protein
MQPPQQLTPDDHCHPLPRIKLPHSKQERPAPPEAPAAPCLQAAWPAPRERANAIIAATADSCASPHFTIFGDHAQKFTFLWITQAGRLTFSSTPTFRGPAARASGCAPVQLVLHSVQGVPGPHPFALIFTLIKDIISGNTDRIQMSLFRNP